MNKLALMLVLIPCITCQAFVDENLFLNYAYKEEFKRQYAEFKSFVFDCIRDPLNNKKVARLSAENRELKTQLIELKQPTDHVSPVAIITPTYRHTLAFTITAVVAFIAVSSIAKLTTNKQ